MNTQSLIDKQKIWFENLDKIVIFLLKKQWKLVIVCLIKQLIQKLGWIVLNTRKSSLILLSLMLDFP